MRENDEESYHFGCQFTADLIAMNSADFIITSTYQEIAGTPEAAWGSMKVTTLVHDARVCTAW